MQLLNTIYKPMLAKAAPKPFSSKDWVFEVKWEGFRSLAYVRDRFSLKSKNGNELKHNFTEIGELKHLASNMVLDGELVVLKGGKPDFEAMQRRSRLRTQSEIEHRARVEPATYVVFDVLEKDGVSLVDLPLIKRKELLNESVKEGKHVCLVDCVDRLGKQYYKIVVASGLEGVVAKRKDGIYEPGIRSESWLKIKPNRSCDCVIIGFTAGEGEMEVTFGSLAVGFYDVHGGLKFS